MSIDVLGQNAGTTFPQLAGFKANSQGLLGNGCLPRRLAARCSVCAAHGAEYGLYKPC